MSISEMLKDNEKNFSYHLDKDPKDDKKVCFVMPVEKLPAPLKGYKSMTKDQQGAAFVDIMRRAPNDLEKRSIQDYGSFRIDGKPATEKDRDIIYRSLRRTGIELAKREAIQVANHSSFAISAADHSIWGIGNKAEQGFDSAYLKALWPMIEKMTVQTKEADSNQLIAMASRNGRIGR